MKKQNVFIGILLIGIGAFFIMDEFQLPFFDSLYSWPSILFLIGLAFLIQSQVSKDDNNLLPAVILMGLGIHFHAVNLFSFWPSGWPVYTFIIGLAFLVRYYKTKKDGLMLGMILILLSVFGLFFQVMQHMMNQAFSYVDQLWPILLIVLGLYLLFIKKK